MEGLAFVTPLLPGPTRKAVHMGKKLLLGITFFLLTFQTVLFTASGQGIFETDKDGTVTARVVNVPLAEVLKNFCATFNLGMKGTPTNDESISFTITKGTFDEALKRLMRGHNYVLIQDAAAGKPTLILLGKAERRNVEDLPAARMTTEPSPYASAVPSSSQEGLTAVAPSPTPALQGSTLSSNAPSAEPRKPQGEESAASVVASARPTHMPSPASSATPPMAPNIPGLELPPVPPTLEQTKSPKSNVTAATASTSQAAVDPPLQIPTENSSSQTSAQTPPQIPTGSDTTPQKAKSSLDLKDLTPPPIPF